MAEEWRERVPRSTAVAAIAVALAIYGIHTASFIPALMAGSAPLLLFGFLLQTCAALLGAVGAWMGRAWAPGAIVLLGGAIAGTALVESIALGLVSLDY